MTLETKLKQAVTEVCEEISIDFLIHPKQLRRRPKDMLYPSSEVYESAMHNAIHKILDE